jgi:hypothetical protein
MNVHVHEFGLGAAAAEAIGLVLRRSFTEGELRVWVYKVEGRIILERAERRPAPSAPWIDAHSDVRKALKLVWNTATGPLTGRDRAKPKWEVVFEIAGGACECWKTGRHRGEACRRKLPSMLQEGSSPDTRGRAHVREVEGLHYAICGECAERCS